MKYASSYYAKMKNFNKAQSNMNRMCRSLETWEKKYVKYQKTYKNFDYNIMIDKHIETNEDAFNKIESIFLEFCTEINDVAAFAHKCKNYNKYKNYFKENYPDETEETIRVFEVNWNYYYETYKKRCLEVCQDKQELANIAVKLCYEKYPSKNKKFIWKVAADGVLLNLEQKDVALPIRDDNGDFEYLGKKYRLENIITSEED